MTGVNDILTTNNLILQADRALSSNGFDTCCLFDLAALIEAVVLHDHLLFLEAPNQFDFNSLPLGHILLNEGIIQSFEPSVSVMEIQDAVYRLFGIPDAYDKVSASPFSTRLGSPSVLPYYGNYDFFSPNRVKTVLAEVELARQLPGSEHSTNPVEETARTLPHYCYSLVEMWAGNNAWARRPAQAFLVRTLVYWAISDRLNISFYPDFARIPIVMEVVNELEKSLRGGGYQALANAFYTTPEELAVLSASLEVPLPPVTALALQDAGSSEEIWRGMLQVRKQFSGLRQRISEYEQAIRSASTLRDLVNARGELLKAATHSARKFELQDRSRIKEATSYFHQFLRLGMGPRDPESYSANLLFKPAEWIKEWWLQRKAIYVFEIGAKIEHFTGYNRSWKKLFHKSLPEDELPLYSDFARAMDGE